MRSLVVVLCLVAACSSSPPKARNGKPVAPITVTIAARDLGHGDHEVTLTATPTRDVDALALELDGERSEAGATRAGEARTLTVQVHVEDGEGRDVIGAARAAGRSKAAIVRVGVPKVETPPDTTEVTMPDGTVVEESPP